jgi:hypothetical protein
MSQTYDIKYIKTKFYSGLELLLFKFQIIVIDIIGKQNNKELISLKHF